jgi:hypothetical protein
VPVLLPALGALIGALLIFSRRTDAILHAQFWAEDGRIYFQNVYNLGVAASLIKPQAGYFQIFPVLAAWIASLFALRDAPLVMSLLALGANVLPVALLLSPRARSIAPDIRVRIALALLFIAIPTDVEIDSIAVNAQWSIAPAALIVLLLEPPRRRAWRIADGLILLICALTGPFAVLLAVIAWIRQRSRGREWVPRAWTVGLSACAILQVICLVIISKHVSGPTIEPRPSPALGASAELFTQLIGGRLLIGSILGGTDGVTASLTLDWIVLFAAIGLFAYVARRGPQELLLLIVLGFGVLGGALANPSAASPAWPALVAVPVSAQRYFLMAELAVLSTLIWIASTQTQLVVRALAGGLVALAIVITVARHWTLPPLFQTGYAASANAFEQARNGTVVAFPITPPPWVMTLTKN